MLQARTVSVWPISTKMASDTLIQMAREVNTKLSWKYSASPTRETILGDTILALARFKKDVLWKEFFRSKYEGQEENDDFARQVPGDGQDVPLIGFSTNLKDKRKLNWPYLNENGVLKPFLGSKNTQDFLKNFEYEVLRNVPLTEPKRISSDNEILEKMFLSELKENSDIVPVKSDKTGKLILIELNEYVVYE